MNNVLDIDFRWIVRNDEKVLQYRKKVLVTDYSLYEDHDSEYYTVCRWQDWVDVKQDLVSI